jgi:hypothetical protein
MKVKKFKQIVKNSDFDTKEEIIFIIYGKKQNSTHYDVLSINFNIDESLEWFTININSKDGNFLYGVNNYEEIILVEEKTTFEILDLDLIINSNKYNL